MDLHFLRQVKIQSYITALRSWWSRERQDDLLPFELVKYFAVTSLLLILLASLVLSWIVSNNARHVLLKRSEDYSRLFAENLNRQVFIQFVLPTVVRYGRIALSDPVQFERLDTIVRNITRGMHIESVSFFDSRENIISYSTVPDLVGKRNMGGLEYTKALHGENNSKLVSSGSLINLVPGMPRVFCRLKTYVPFRQEDRQGERTGDIMGVIEVVQDLSDDLAAIIGLQGRIIVVSLLIMSVLFTILGLIVIKANRIMAARARERLRLEEKLNQAERLATLGKMVASVSHEIKNPLGIVRSTAEILGKRITQVAPGNEHLARIIVDETSRLDAIVREFLDFARPRELRLQAGSVNDIVERLNRIIGAELESHGIELVTDLDPNLFHLPLDRDQLYQALFNIAHNAQQAMPDGGRLCIRTANLANRTGVEIKITDSGCGIGEEKISDIFTPFFTDKHRGTGLGLAITRNIIEKHGGTIEVHSQEGEGATFRIVLFRGKLQGKAR